jgi:hypothetical protein
MATLSSQLTEAIKDAIQGTFEHNVTTGEWRNRPSAAQARENDA